MPDSGAVGGRRSRRCEREREHQLRGAAYGVSGDAAAPKSSYSEVSYGTVRRRGGTGGAKRRRCRCEREGKHQLREAAGDASAQESSFHDPHESEGDNGHRGCQTAELSTDGEAVDAGAKAGISCLKQRTARPRTLPWQSRLQRILAWNRMMTMRRRRRWAAKPSMRARGKHQLREAADGAPEGVAVSDNHDLRSGFSKIPLHWLLLALGIQNLKNSLSCTLHSEWGIPKIQSSKCSNSRHFAMVCARGAGKSGNSKRQ